MKAFHGSEEVKAKYTARLAAHHAADEIIQGTGYNGSHGCAVGCTLNAYDHRAYETELGLPKWLAHLEDRIFEGLPAGDAKQFAVDFLTAVPVGADVSKVRWLLASQRHTRDRDRLLSNPEPYAKQCVEAINQVIAYCDLEVSGSAARSAWSARSAARSAAQSAARSAESAAESAESARSATWSARSAEWSARSAEWSAEWSARSAEWSAESATSATSAAESAAWSAASGFDHFRWEAKTLLELLRGAPQAKD